MTSNSFKLQLGDQDIIDVFKALTYTVKQFDVYKAYNVDQYLTAYGLCVNPEYRGRGVATEMLKARAPILKALGLKVTSTAFTGIGSQTAAKKAGYDEVFVIPFADIEKMIPGFDFSKNVTKYFKTMALKLWGDVEWRDSLRGDDKKWKVMTTFAFLIVLSAQWVIKIF